MPWSSSDAVKHNHKLKKSKKARKAWAKVANEHLKKTGDEGASIRIANHVANKIAEKHVTHANTMEEILIRKKIADAQAKGGKPKMEELRNARSKINYSGNSDIELSPNSVNETYSPDKNTSVLGNDYMSKHVDEWGKNFENRNLGDLEPKGATLGEKARYHVEMHMLHKNALHENRRPENADWHEELATHHEDAWLRLYKEMRQKPKRKVESMKIEIAGKTVNVPVYNVAPKLVQASDKMGHSLKIAMALKNDTYSKLHDMERKFRKG